MAAVTKNPDVLALISAAILELDDMMGNQCIATHDFIFINKTEFASPFRKLLDQVSMSFGPSIL